MVVARPEQALLQAVLLKAIWSNQAPASRSSSGLLLPPDLAPQTPLECEWQQRLLAGLPEPASALPLRAQPKRKCAELPESPPRWP